MTHHRARTGRQRGLTLLEVLAATLIFSLVMTALIGTSSSGVHRVGQALRRLEADQVADAVVADLEIQMRKRIAPVIERDEWKTEAENEEEAYTIRVLNRSIQEALAAPATTVAEEAAGAAPVGQASGPGATQIGGASGMGTMLASELPEVAKHLRQYDIEVIWNGPGGPESVTRTTFAFDWEAAQAEFAELFAAAGGEDAADGEEEDGEDETDEDGEGPGVPRQGPPPGGIGP